MTSMTFDTRRALAARAITLATVTAGLSACHLCDYREVPAIASQSVPRGQPCPAADRAAVGDVVRVVGLRSQHDEPGVQSCCYQVQVHQQAIDTYTEASYLKFEGFSPMRCLSATEVFQHPPGEVSESVPYGAKLEAVTVGPTEAHGSCIYTIHVVRAELRESEPVCAVETLEAFAYDLAVCPSPAALLAEFASKKRSLLGNKEVTSVASGPTVDESQSHLPDTACTYDVIGKHTADVCG